MHSLKCNVHSPECNLHSFKLNVSQQDFGANSCTVLYTNADGILNKRDELQTIVAKVNPHIMAITELIPKNIQKFELIEYQIPGYTCLLTQSQIGVLVYI